MEDDETLQQEEGEGGEEEEDVERDDEGAGGGEETDGCDDEAQTEADLEPNLSHVVRVQTTEKAKNWKSLFDHREPLGHGHRSLVSREHGQIFIFILAES